MKIKQRPGQGVEETTGASSKLAKSAIPIKKTSGRFFFITFISLGSIFLGAEVAHRIFKPDVTVKIDLSDKHKLQ